MNQSWYMYFGIAVIVLLCVGGLVLVQDKVMQITTSEPMSDGQIADSGIGPYSERPNAGGQEPVATAPLVDGCGLQFTLMPVSKIVAPGGQISYTARVENRGRAPCANVSFSIYYSDNETYVSSNPKPTSATNYWRLGDLKSREVREVGIRTTAGSEHVTTEACATGDNSADVCPQATVLVQTGVPATVAGMQTPNPGHLEYGTWIWESPRAMSASYRESLLDEAESAGFDVVYVTIDDYLSIHAMPEGSAKAAARSQYESAVAALVRSAAARGIAVDLEGGARDWAEPANRYKGYALIDFVKSYNDTHQDARVRGFQYDVEPYLLPRYESNKAVVLKEFVEFIGESTERLQGSSVQFSVVIPHFYDAGQAWTPAVSYNGKNTHAYTHLLDILESKKGSTIIVMAYRNFYDGEDGTGALVGSELAEARTASTKVIVAQETGNVDPGYVTFYGSRQSEFLKAVARIYSSLGGESAFGGVAVHYLDSYLALRK